jgi:hypothetical protein
MNQGHLCPNTIGYMSYSSTHPFAVGEYRITPLSRSHGEHQHTAVLSVQRGTGRQTHDRIYTFKPEFKTQDSALMYAAARGRYWLLNPASLS